MERLKRILLLSLVLMLGTSVFSQESQKDRKLFLGGNLGVGLGQVHTKWIGNMGIPGKRTSEFIPMKVGIDIAYETTEDIYLGVYSAVGLDLRNERQHFDLGALLLVGLNESYKLILGAGANTIDYKYYGGNLRIGFETPRNIYIMLEANYRDQSKNNSRKTATTTSSLLISFGYRIF